MNIRKIFEKEGLDPTPYNIRLLIEKWYELYCVDGIITTENVPEMIEIAVTEGNAEWIRLPCALKDWHFQENVMLNIKHVKSAFKLAPQPNESEINAISRMKWAVIKFNEYDVESEEFENIDDAKAEFEMSKKHDHGEILLVQIIDQYRGDDE